MNEMEKFVTIFCVICGVYSVYEKCEANPRNGCREFLKRWKTLLQSKADISKLLVLMLLVAVIEREREIMEDEDEAELPEMEDDVPVDQDLFAYYDDDGYPSDDKGTLQDHEFNPKLVHLVISVVFMLATFTSVLFLRIYSEMISEYEEEIILF
ncbi:uncharacterized protein LOC114959990 [Acropora millepora]|uniref:uncharacterized protein LOC114959990 n=1 Tax=Acropora millepora TaxID=45264 RepID=UPI001CF4DDCC|nr:uncharacterized protein LOC114959990 [Acropora millepora]